jgi:hypothetical protein
MRKFFILCVVAIIPAAVGLLVSCAPTYDAIADQMLADTQKQADEGLIKLQYFSMTIDSLAHSTNANDIKTLADDKTKASYPSNTEFYADLQASIQTLEIRMTATPDLSTTKLTNAFTQLESNVETIRALHASQNILGAAYLKDARQILDQQFKALTVYELTIKSGSKPQ